MKQIAKPAPWAGFFTRYSYHVETMIFFKMHLAPSILLITAAMSLAVNTATAQDTGTQKQNRCKLIKAQRGSGAELVPEGELDADQERVFFYVFDQERLLDDFRVEDDRRRDCLTAFGLQHAAGQSGTSTASAGGASAGGAAAGGVAAAGAGIGTIAIGATAVAVGLGVIAVGAAVGVASGLGKAGDSTSTTCTTCN